MNIKHRHSLVFISLIGCWLVSSVSLAGNVVLYRQGETPDPVDIAKILTAPHKAPQNVGRTRGLKLLDDAPDVAMDAGPVDRAEAVALQVQFPFNSAKIPPGNQTRIVVEGHTDAVGTADYNFRLSHRRAAAVKQYIVARHGIAPQVLEVVGLGKSAPLMPKNPYAAENRRVQFRLADTLATATPAL